MDVDPEKKDEAEHLRVDNPALTTALKAVSSLTREQNLKGCFVANP